MKFNIRKARSCYRYQKARKRFLASDPLCAECLRQGIVTASAEVDHIAPAHGSSKLFWDLTNWQGLCCSCHKTKTAQENSRPKAPGHDEWMEAVRG